MIHQSNPSMAADSEFEPGCLALLCPGNHCRLLDQRRTPGVIEAYFPESASFRWRLLDFEDKGKHWDVPAEDVTRYQFARDSTRLDAHAISTVERQIASFQKELRVDPDPARTEATRSALQSAMVEADRWLSGNSLFFRAGNRLDLDRREGSTELAEDLGRYLHERGLGVLETRTAETYVLNPHSGDWIKGMRIVLAEMGLQPFHDKVPRTADVFSGEGAREKRTEYCVQRLAFLRAAFSRMGITEVVLYRGMSAEDAWKPPTRPGFSSWTFSLEVAQSFCDFARTGRARHSYLFKRTFPVDRLFLTYLETGAMNRQYKEAEAVLFWGD